jgi:hypothetical protein
MIDENLILPFNFFSYNGVYTGEEGEMRYRISHHKDADKDENSLRIQVWQGPFAYQPSLESGIEIIEEDFEFSAEGRLAAIARIKELIASSDN